MGEVDRSDVYALIDALLRENSKSDWDGYGATAVSKKAAAQAKRFADGLPPDIPNPDAYTDPPDGDVCLEWGASDAVFSVSVGPNGVLTYAWILGGECDSGIVMWRPGDDVSSDMLCDIRAVVAAQQKVSG